MFYGLQITKRMKWDKFHTFVADYSTCKNHYYMGWY